MESFPQYKTHNWGMKWTEEEDFRLLQAIERLGGNDWKKIADFVGTRDAVKCIQRWDKVLRPDLIKGKWTEDEDNQLRYVVMQGYEHWGKVCEKMPGRTAKQCRERWANYLDPTLLKTPFTQAEDEILLALQKEHGNKWSLISRQLHGRTENAVKLRYHALMRAYGASVRTASLQQQQQQHQPVTHPMQAPMYPQLLVPAPTGLMHASSSSGHQQSADENAHKRQRTGGAMLEQYMYAPPQGMPYYAQPGYLSDPAQHPSYTAMLSHLQTSLCMPSAPFGAQVACEGSIGGAEGQQEYSYDAIFAPQLPPQDFGHVGPEPAQDQDPVQEKAVVSLGEEVDRENSSYWKDDGGYEDATATGSEQPQR